MDRSQVLALIEQRTHIDHEIDELRSVLNTQGVGMDEPLVDEEGFPRNDVDIPQVRELRVKIIRLENDRVKLMEQIKLGLEQVLKADSSQPSTYQRPALVPFAYINEVTPGFAAEQGGLRKGDEILRFGKVDHTNHNGLLALPNELGTQTIIQVSRQGQPVELVIEGERLGCQILPL